jgi:hypothetical protein
MSFELQRKSALSSFSKQPYGSVERKTTTRTDNLDFMGTDGAVVDSGSFTAKMMRVNIKVNERGLFDKLLVNKSLIEGESCILLSPNDSITNTAITKYKINDKVTFGVSSFVVRSIKEINPANEATPILSYLLCEVI